MKTNLVLGIDVSKSELDFAEMADSLKQQGCIDNKLRCIKKHLSQYDKDTVRIVFEPTGTYSDKLEQVLIEMGFVYHRVNPSQSHHFALSIGVVNKTDRQAAITLAKMGKALDLPIYHPPSQSVKKRKGLLKALANLVTEQERYKNRLHAEIQLVQPDNDLVSLYQDLIKIYEDKITNLQKKLVDQEDSKFQANKKLGMSVCGIGEVNAVWLLTFTNNLENFDVDKRVVKFLGLAPSSHRSGTSVNKKYGVNKSCAGKIKGNLFMGAKSAIRFNPACKDLYQRLRNKGKNYYQAMIAVMGKLVRQFFAVVKSGVPFDKEYHLKFQKI